MRVQIASFPILVALAAACGTAAPAPGTQPDAPTANVAASAVADAPAVKATADDPAWKDLANKWVVILASARNPDQAVPGLAVAQAHPELAVSPVVFPSGRFKNLMPCYTVTGALATTDKARALALSKSLKALGVDNYVKNTGAWAGRSIAIEAYCEARPGAANGAVTVATHVEGGLWMPVEVPEPVLKNALTGASVALNTRYDAWRQPVSQTVGGAVTVGSAYVAVNVTTGQSGTCKVAELAGLTLGTPHFGAVHGENGPPRKPMCGEARIYARLECSAPTADGMWIVTPTEGAKLAAYAPVSAVAPGLVDAAKAALTRDTDWEEAEGDEGVTHELHVTRWHGDHGDVVLVEGVRLDGNDVCGGSDERWYAAFRVDGDTLGAPYGTFLEGEYVDELGVVDMDGDGQPEIVNRAFPETTEVQSSDGTVRASLTLDYCDCPC